MGAHRPTARAAGTRHGRRDRAAGHREARGARAEHRCRKSKVCWTSRTGTGGLAGGVGGAGGSRGFEVASLHDFPVIRDWAIMTLA
jgi:hypothetical protein